MQRVISVYYLIFYAAMAATYPFLSLYLRGKGIDSTNIGLLLAVGSAAGILAQPVLGYINDRSRDPRRILLISALLSPILYAGYAVFSHFWILIVISVLMAAVQSAAPIMDAITLNEAERSGRFTYGQIRLWGALGFAISAAIAGYVYHSVGIGTSFVVYGVLSVILVWAAFYLPKTSKRVHTREPLLRGIWNVARRKTLTAFIVICFLLSTCVAVNFNFLPLYYQALHYPMRWVGLNFTVAALVEVPLFYISAKLIARWKLMPVLILGVAIYVVKYAIMSIAPGAFIVISVQILDGVAYALYWSASVQLVSELAPPGRSATAQALYSAVAFSLSSIVGAAFGGWELDHYGPLAMYRIVTIMSALSVICFLIFARFGLRKSLHDPSASASPWPASEPGFTDSSGS